MLLLIARVFFWVLGIMFLVGIAGSAVVITLTSIEDLHELKREKPEEGISEARLRPGMAHGD